MAPEVLCGEAEAGGAAADMSSYREPADVWSLGVVLFEALVLSRPFEVRAPPWPTSSTHQAVSARALHALGCLRCLLKALTKLTLMSTRRGARPK